MLITWQFGSGSGSAYCPSHFLPPSVLSSLAVLRYKSIGRFIPIQEVCSRPVVMARKKYQHQPIGVCYPAHSFPSLYTLIVLNVSTDFYLMYIPLPVRYPLIPNHTNDTLTDSCLDDLGRPSSHQEENRSHCHVLWRYRCHGSWVSPMYPHHRSKLTFHSEQSNVAYNATVRTPGSSTSRVMVMP